LKNKVMNYQETLDSLSNDIETTFIDWYYQYKAKNNPGYSDFINQRSCLEKIYKYCTFRYFKSNNLRLLFDDLKRQGWVNYDDGIGCKAWQKIFQRLIIENKIILSFDFDFQTASNIISLGNKKAHQTLYENEFNIIEINNFFSQTVISFFVNSLNQINWVEDSLFPNLFQKNSADSVIHILNNKYLRPAPVKSIEVIDETYWSGILEKINGRSHIVYESIFKRCHSFYVQEYIALELSKSQTVLAEIDTIENPFLVNDIEGRYISQSFSNLFYTFKDITLLKILGASGEGKTVLFTKISRWLSQKGLPTYRINDFEETTLSQINSIVTSSDRAIFIIDTASDYELVLNKLYLLQEDFKFKNILFVITDQPERYNKCLKEGNKCFDNLFTEKYTLSYKNSKANLRQFYEHLIKYYNLSSFEKKELCELFEADSNKTLEVRWSEFNKIINDSNTPEFDWVIFDNICMKQGKIEFKELYTLIASFTIFKDLQKGVPLSFLQRNYYPQYSMQQIADFINNECQGYISEKQNLVRLWKERNSLEFIEEPSNRIRSGEIIKAYLEQMLSDESFCLDSINMYVLRNIHREFDKEDAFVSMPKKDRTGLFYKYADRNTDKIEIGKCLMEVLYLTDNIKEKIDVAELMFELDETSIHTITKLAQLYLFDGQHSFAIRYLNIGIGLDPFNSFVIRLEMKFYDKIKYPINFFERVKSVDSLDDETLYYVMINVNKLEVFVQDQFSEAIQAGDFTNRSLKVKQACLNLLLYQKKYQEAKSFSDKYFVFKEKRILDIMIQYEILSGLRAWSEAEELLKSSLIELPSYPSLYILLLKTYRKILRTGVLNKSTIKENQEWCLSKLNEMNIDSVEKNTESAKYLLENHNDRESHQRAKELLEHNITQYQDNTHSTTELAILYQRSEHFRNIDFSINLLKDFISQKLEYENKDYKNIKRRRDNDLTAVNVVLATAYIQKGDQDSLLKAKEVLEKIENKNPGNDSTYLRLLEVYSLLNDIDNVNRILTIVSNAKERFSGQFSFSNMAHFYYTIQSPGGIANILDTLIEKFPNNHVLLNQAVNALLILTSHYQESDSEEQAEMIDKAIGYSEKAYLLNQDNTHAIRNLVYLYDKEILGKQSDFLFQRNLYFSLFMKKAGESMFMLEILEKLFCHEPRLVAVYMDQNIKYEYLSDLDKARYLSLKKKIYTKLNFGDGILRLDTLMNEIQKKSNYTKKTELQKIIQDYWRRTFRPRPIKPIDFISLSLSGVVIKNDSSLQKNCFITYNNKYYLCPNSFQMKNKSIVYFSLCTDGIQTLALFPEPFFPFSQDVKKYIFENLPSNLNLLSHY
jgi:hypothetical protein